MRVRRGHRKLLRFQASTGLLAVAVRVGVHAVMLNAATSPVIAQTAPIAPVTPSTSTATTRTVVPGVSASAPQPVPRLPAGEIDPSRLMADQVAGMARQMAELTGDQESRDVAARRLLTIGTNDSRTALANALRDPNNPGGRLAAARAVADDIPPGPEFVDPLFVLIDTEASPQLMDAASVALGNYKSMPDVTVRLIALTDVARSVGVRTASIKALSTQIEKRAAARLVVLAQEAASTPIATAANDALQAFTELNYDNARDWSSWWRTQADLPDDRFRIDTLTARVNRAQQQARLGDETYQELSASMIAALTNASRDQRGDIFVTYLRSPRQAVRLIAIRRAYLYSSDFPPAVRPAVRELLSDVSADVRFEAARIVQVLNDADAFAYLAQQSAVEPEIRVRAKLADALGTIGNIDALPLLRGMLDDSSNLVVQSSAAAIEKMGPAIVQAKPRDADELSIKLQRVLANRAPAGSGGTLRQSLVAALVPLKQRALLRTFAEMLPKEGGETPAIRALAARALGAVGDPAIESPLVDALSDPAPEVRIEVVQAIGKVSQDFNNAPRLLALLDPAAEPAANVRTAAWEVIRGQLKIAPLDQLIEWPDRPLLRQDEAKRLEIYTVLAERWATAKRPNDQMDALQHVGECQMNLGEAIEKGVDPDRDAATILFAAAANSYSSALAIAKASGSAMTVQTLTMEHTRALLRARDYPGASQFTRNLPQDYQEAVSALWKLEAERLDGRKNADDDASALQLIAAAGDMGAVIKPYHQAQLTAIRSSIEQRQNEKNQYALPDWMRAVCMR